MDKILALRTRLKPIATTGGRVHLNDIEIRAAMFSARVNLGAPRKRAWDERRKDAAAKRSLGIDKESIRTLTGRTARLVKSLEVCRKRANRHFVKAVPADDRAIRLKEWQEHLRWMKYHITCFKPLLVGGLGQGRRTIIDALVNDAQAGLRNQGFQLPSDGELRDMMRGFARYSRRRRIEKPHLGFVLWNFETANAQNILVNFIKRRYPLQRIAPGSPNIKPPLLKSPPGGWPVAKTPPGTQPPQNSSHGGPRKRVLLKPMPIPRVKPATEVSPGVPPDS